MNRKLWITSLFFFVLQTTASAYLDEVLMTPNEVWTAAVLVMEPLGVASADKQSYTLKSKWIEDTVRKEKKLWPDQLGGRAPTLPKTVRRRYQLTVRLEELKTATQVQVTGKFQERPVGSPEHQSRWRTVKPSTEDYEVERAFFFKILREMSRIKTSPQA